MTPEENSDEASRGTVNVVTTGWLNLWKKIVAKDLMNEKGVKFRHNVNITSITRTAI